MQDALRRALAAEGGAAFPAGRTAPPSRRHARRPDVVTYRLKVHLAGTEPPLWRSLDVASDLRLDDLHGVIQVAFGWTDSHLHRFASGPDYSSAETEYYLCPFEVEEGEVGIPEEEVRLDEVLVDVGDELLYLYDFGDDWNHVVTLEAVRERPADARRAVCVAGERPGPAEDCGGVHGYELFVDANNPEDPRSADAAAELSRLYGFSGDWSSHRPTPFDLDQINDELADFDAGDAESDARLPGPVAGLLSAVWASSLKRQLRRLVSNASLDEPVDIDAETAAQMVHPYMWLLHRVGEDGIKLTGAGYLPPAHVEAAMTELNLEGAWYGKNNRENHAIPVLMLRESAQAMGLIRKYRGSVRLTSRGRALLDDPVALWWHMAERMPLKSRKPYEIQASLVIFIIVAGMYKNSDDELPNLDEAVAKLLVADTLTALGWSSDLGEPVTASMASHATRETVVVLRRLTGVTDDDPLFTPIKITPGCVAFARAALQRWV
nr:plasmid pRiA4b ORF-3 family protein [Phytoactinopolyspora alkaliphila]